MDAFQLLTELRKGEGQTIEFKSSFSNIDAIGRAFASFSSKNNGDIYVGVDDKGNPIGIETGEKIKDRLTTLANIIKPCPAEIFLEFILHNHKKYIVHISVSKGNGELYSYKGDYYERRGAINFCVPLEEAHQKLLKTSKVSFGDMPARSQERPAYVSDINGEKLIEFLKIRKELRKKIFNFIDIKQTLINLGLICEDNIQVKKSAILMFGKNPQKFVSQSKINLNVYEGEDKTSKFIRHSITGTIYDMLNETMLYINRYMRKISKIKGLKRIEFVEYPEEALREGLVNTLAHRDYWYQNSEIFINMFKNRIEIVNPGGFPFDGVLFNEVKKGGLSVRRNPPIAKLLDDLSLMEQQGTGFEKMGKKMLKHGLKKPKLKVSENFFKIIFYGTEGDIFQLEKLSGKETDLSELSKKQITALNLVEKDESISSKEYSNYFSVSQRQAIRDLKELCEKGFLFTRGSGIKLRYYKKNVG